MTPQTVHLLEALEAINAGTSLTLTPWEHEFLGSVLPRLRAGGTLSPKQLAVVYAMTDKYLPSTMGAELRGQERLFA